MAWKTLPMKSSALSPSLPRIGAPMNRKTSERSLGKKEPTGIASCPPSMAIGTSGTPTCIDRAAAPDLNCPMSPVRDRVPSGKTRMGTPARRSRPVIPAARPCSAVSRLPLRSIGYELKNTEVNAEIPRLR